jgi:hypothetical protein
MFIAAVGLAAAIGAGAVLLFGGGGSSSPTPSAGLATALHAVTAQGDVTQDAAAKELAHTAQVAIETCATDNNGSYTKCGTPAVLNSYESTIPTAAGGGDAWLSSVSAKTSSYTVTSSSTTADTFSISRSTAGSIARTCTPPDAGGCTNGTW